MDPGLGTCPVEAVILDYGLTLVTYTRPDSALRSAYTEIAALLAQHQGRAIPRPDALLLAVHDRVDEIVAAHESAGNLEEIDHAAVTRTALAAIGIDVGADTVDALLEIEQRAWWHGMRVAPDALPTLRTLQSAGLRVGLCSNAPYRPASLHAQLDHLGFAGCFDAVVFSSEVGWRKPSSQIFTKTLDALGAPAAATVVVGDRCREDVGGAHLSGMRAIRLREHHDDVSGVETPELVLDRLRDLPAALLPPT